MSAYEVFIVVFAIAFAIGSEIRYFGLGENFRRRHKD